MTTLTNAAFDAYLWRYAHPQWGLGGGKSLEGA